MSTALTPKNVTDQLIRLMQQGIVCVEEEEAVRLDTPYVLQDGHALRVYLTAGGRNGDIIASDDGFATAQIETFVQSRTTLQRRYVEMQRIALELGLEWDVDFRVRGHGLEETLQKLATLAQAVDRSLSLVQPQPDHTLAPMVAELGREFRLAGLKVIPRARIAVPTGQVHVDYRLIRGGSEAAVEVLSGRTIPGAQGAVDAAIADFHVLDRGGYQGKLLAVFDENSAMNTTRMRGRFGAAKPERAEIVPGRQAVRRAMELLAS